MPNAKFPNCLTTNEKYPFSTPELRARRIWQRLVAEHGAGLAEGRVSRYVARRRAELGLDKIEVTVPREHAPGAEAEVDFGEFCAMVTGVLLKLWMFVMRLSCSGRASMSRSRPRAQEAFLEGHVLAFEYFGAVPGRVRYDNLKPAVVRVLRGRDRAESERSWTTTWRPAPSPTASPPARPPHRSAPADAGRRSR